jgi:hypothetical protein
MKTVRPALFLLIILAFLLSACGAGSVDANRQSTIEAISASVRATATAEAFLSQNPNAPLETARAEVTAQAGSVLATAAAFGQLSEADQAATLSAAGPILAELPKYGVDPQAGRLAWVHPPVSLEVEGFMNFDYVNYFIATLAADFVASADITWDAIGSESSCGFVLRSDGNEEAMDTYLATISRVASGHFLFLQKRKDVT